MKPVRPIKKKGVPTGTPFLFKLEARVGIEPTHGAFAEPGLTTWLPRLKTDWDSNCLLGEGVSRVLCEGFPSDDFPPINEL